MGPARPYLQTLVTVFCLFFISKGVRPEVHGKVGGVVELECSFPPPDPAVSTSPHVVEWVRQGFNIPVLIQFGVYTPHVHPKYEGRVSLVRTTALRMKGLELEDQGLYQCRILLLDKHTDEHRSGTWTQLSVTAPPTFTKTPPPVLEALAGSQLSLACVANGNPTPTITWLKDGGVIQGINEEGTLSLRTVSMQSGGQYTCHASNSEGNVTHMMKLKIKGPPVIVIPPKSTSLNMSQNALLRCQAVADPPNMTYVWQKGGENVHHIESLKSRVKIMVDGTLLVSNLIPEDSGNYTCMPTNGLLTPPTASAKLTVMHPAKALQTPKETYLPTGMDGLVTCPVVAQPPLVRVDWTKDGEPLVLALYPGWTLTSEGSLFMATVNDDAAGVYTCTPYNSYGSMGSSDPTTVVLQDPPSFSITPEKQYKQEVGGTLLIPCQGNGDPAISVTWSKVGPAPRSVYSVAANGSLLLQPLSKDHQGEWECTAANRVASVKASALVFVLGTSPHAAISLSVSPGVNQVNISWEAGFDGGSAQTFSVWVKQVSVSDNDGKQDWFSVPVPPLSGTNLQLTGLSPATDYQLSILSHNRVGTGPFGEITSIRTLDPPPRRSKLKPPVSLSANQGSAGVVLQWSLPAAPHPPITGFVLQSRTEQGEWFNLDEDINANSSEIIVPGLRKDCVYELRLLSRRGELLSEPSPSVNVSTMGMEIYPATSQLLEFVPEPLLAGVMGGVGFMCLALILLLGSACVISHKRDQRRRKRKDELAPAIYKCPPSIRTSGTGSPDSVLKKSLLQTRSLYPTTSSTTTSSSQSDCSSFSKDSHTEYQNQRQQHLSTSRHPLNPTDNRGHLTRAASTPMSPSLELISRGPDGRFIVQPYDQASTLSVHTIRRSLRKDYSQPTSIQRSVSLHSERGDRREPPFVLSVDLPPCGLVESNSMSPVQAMAQHLSHHGHCILDQEAEYGGCPELSSLYSDNSHTLATIPHSDRDISATYPILKSIGQPSTTASTLVLQMEHERERGNLSRCLKLAQEREELERELQKYTLDRNTTEEMSREPDMELEERNGRKTSDNELVLKLKSNTFPHSHPQGSKGSCGLLQGPSSSSSVHWETRPLIFASTVVPAKTSLNRSPPVSPSYCSFDTQYPAPSFTKQTSVRSEGADSPSKDRLTLPHLSSKLQRHKRVEAGLEGYDNSPQSALIEMQRNDSCSEAWRQNNLSHGRLSTMSSSHTNKYTEISNFTVSAVPGSSKAEIVLPKSPETHSEGMCIEMSVDEPELEVSVVRPTTPMLHHRIASHVQEGHSLTHKDQYEDMRSTSFSLVPGEDFERRPEKSNRVASSPQSPQPKLWKAVSRGSQNLDCKQRSQSLDSKRQNQSNFLTPDAWIDSLSQENCSTAFSFRPDSLFWAPQSTPILKTPRSPADSSSAAQSLPPQPLEQPPSAPLSPPSVDPSSPRSIPQKLIPNPTVPCHHEPRRDMSIFPDASRWPITYQETRRSVQHMEAINRGSQCSLPIGTERGLKDNSRLPDSRGRPRQASLHRDLSCPSPSVDSPPPSEGKKEEQDEKEEENDDKHSGQEAEVEIGGYEGVPESGGSYSSYASSGRGSLEPANGRLSLCMSPTLTSSPETVEESQGNTEDKDLHQMEPSKRRKASVDENYEWDAADVCLQLGDHDGLPPSLNLHESTPCCSLPSMQCSAKALKNCTQLRGQRQSSCYSDPEPDTVLF